MNLYCKFSIIPLITVKSVWVTPYKLLVSIYIYSPPPPRSHTPLSMTLSTINYDDNSFIQHAVQWHVTLFSPQFFIEVYYISILWAKSKRLFKNSPPSLTCHQSTDESIEGINWFLTQKGIADHVTDTAYMILIIHYYWVLL